MNTQSWVARVLTFTSLAALGADPQPAVIAEPDEARFHSMDDTVSIRLYAQGKPLPSNALKGVRAVIGNNTYTHQFEITSSDSGDAVVTVKPNPEEAQVGTFMLIISTKQGDAVVGVDMPLDEMPDTLENRAKAEGITVDELKAKLGLSHEAKRETITVRLPQWQYEGSTFALRVPTTAGRTFTWKVNGTVVDQGLDKNSLSYVLGFPGDHHIEMEARDKEVIVAQWSGILRVIPYPDMKWQVQARKPFELRGPRGYTVYAWKVDGHGAGNDEIFKHTFKDAGEHAIECVASDPIIGKPGEFRRFVWKTQVLSSSKKR